MITNLSSWILEDIDIRGLIENDDISLSTIPTNDYTESYSNYSDYSKYSKYSDYSEYSKYSKYSNYENYSAYSNSITIITNPVSQTIRLGNNVTFTVIISQSDPTYQWYESSSESGGGEAIPGATSSSYTFMTTSDKCNKYYYCVVSRGGNTVTSTSALLTLIELKSADIAVAVQNTKNIITWQLPVSSTILSYEVTDTSIASIVNGILTGIKTGTTTATLTGSNGIVTTINIIVYDNSSRGLLEAVLKNIAIAIRMYTNNTIELYANQFYNMLINNTPTAKDYDSIKALFIDLADGIRSLGVTETFTPDQFYDKILGLISL